MLKIIILIFFFIFNFSEISYGSIKDKIIELSAYKFIDGKPADSFTYLINPNIKINSTVTRITGITNNMLHDA